jgi:hypothetical protein
MKEVEKLLENVSMEKPIDDAIFESYTENRVYFRL